MYRPPFQGVLLKERRELRHKERDVGSGEGFWCHNEHVELLVETIQ